MMIFNDPFQIRCHQTKTTIYNATHYIGYSYHWKLHKVNSVIKMIYLRIQFVKLKRKGEKAEGKEDRHLKAWSCEHCNCMVR